MIEMATASTTLGNGNGGANVSGWQRLLRQRDILLPIAVVAVVAMMIVPLPTVFLDLLLIVNLSIGLYHPPIGTTLFITSSIAKVRIGDVVVERSEEHTSELQSH